MLNKVNAVAVDSGMVQEGWRNLARYTRDPQPHPLVVVTLAVAIREALCVKVLEAAVPG